MADPDDGAETAREVVDRHLAAVERDLAAVLGDRSLCAVSRSAGSVPAAKYQEGRLAALTDLRRILRGAGQAEGLVAATAARWRAALDRDLELNRSADWRAYRAGGVDELDAVDHELSGR